MQTGGSILLTTEMNKLEGKRVMSLKRLVDRWCVPKILGLYFFLMT